jgi:hypothetical protein
VWSLKTSNFPDGRSGVCSAVEGYEVVCLSVLCVYTVVFLNSLRAIRVTDARSVVRYIYADNLLHSTRKVWGFSAMK